MKPSLNLKFEKAIRFLTKHFPTSDETSRKPVLFHDIRVGVYLYEKGYSEDIVLAGLLHDTIEWSEVDEKMLREKFGDKITKIVLANTKDKSIEKKKKNEEMIKRCAENGVEALIVRAADTIDSFKYYTLVNNQDELQNHCIKIANFIFKYKSDDFDDGIFEELRVWLEKLKNS